MEQLQQFTLDHVADSLARHADRPKLSGRTRCANVECDALISSARQEIGAQLCLDCQQQEEQEAKRGRRACL
jgi:hypothetical protein